MAQPSRDETAVSFYVRGESKLTRETIMGERWIRWAYQNGRSGLRQKAFSSSLLSRLMGFWNDSRFSRRRIHSAIEELAIDEKEFADPVESFGSFNQFFYRKLKPDCRPFDEAPSYFVSPADGRVFVFDHIDGDSLLPVKGSAISIDRLLAGDGRRFHGGAALIARLCPADYHRYHFPCAGTLGESWQVRGGYHSVSPIALDSGADVFCANRRWVTFIDSEQFGQIAYVEVGAFGVGSIVNTRRRGKVEKMDEKGYFKFGGSSIVLLLEPNRLTFDDDLLANTKTGHETLVRVGETIGRAP